MTESRYIVAIGASAGGLEPCERFFDNAPVNQGFTYVVVQPQSAEFRSLMDELSARHSSMPVFAAEDGMKIEPNTIYLNRPQQVLTLSNGHFLAEAEQDEDALRLPIDDFFGSIAREYKDRSIAVILSGTGSDGMRGVRQVKSQGGLVFAQSVDTAKFDSMPKSAISTKIVDGTAAPQELPQLIARWIAHDVPEDASSDRAETGDPVADILVLMQEKFGTDFSIYETESIGRRMTRRKDLSGFANMREYYQALTTDQHQVALLYNDLLIEVTSFFRDQASSCAMRVSELETLLAKTEERLQATIEEMETANEELQATNEELHAVSAEHELKIEELSELTSDMDHLLKSTEIGTIFLDQELHVRRFTPAAGQTLNLTAQDIGQALLRWTKKGGAITYCNDRFAHVSGETVSNIGNNGEKTLLVMSTDVTDLMDLRDEGRHLDKSLSQQHSDFKEIYRHMPAMMLTTDDNGIIQDVNDLLTDMGGYERAEMIGKPFDNFFRALSHDPLMELTDIFEGGGRIVDCKSFTCADGRQLSVEVAGLDDHPLDRDIGRVWVIQDVTARNAALAALHDKNVELELVNDGLAQFAHAASHELQEPLRKIRQYGALLAEDYGPGLDEDATYYVDVMTSSAARMSSLVKNLLQFSAASQGDITPKPVRLGALVCQTLDEHKHMIEDAKAEVTVGSLPSVECDANLIQIVISNIISNALKYRATRRRLKIDIKAITPKTGSNAPIVIQFRDNGIGFDAGEAERIFDPFVRLVSKSQVQGSGIGLAICRTICERHGWTLSAESQQGKYAAFTIKIPHTA